MIPLLSLMTSAALAAPSASAPKTAAQLFQLVRGCVYEVVIPKRVDSGATYAERLPLDKLSFQERTDSVWSIGSAFAIGKDTVLTAAHVLNLGVDDPSREPMLRDASGRVLRMGRMLKFSNHQDFALFTVPGLGSKSPLRPAKAPEIGGSVHAVGNALGEGVVLRDGLLTSKTPEPIDGEWKYWRFSAAASPGNSGGPLLDANGQLVGIVLMKSESENLNYALPWDVVASFPSGQGRYFENSRFNHPMFPDLELMTVTDSLFPLPFTWTELDHEVWSRSSRKTARDRDSLLTSQRDSLFPRGRSGKLRLGPLFCNVPSPMFRAQDGWWAFLQQEVDNPVDLGSNGLWIQAKSSTMMSATISLPDGERMIDYVQDSRKLGDLILKGGRLFRTVAGKQIRVTSLGRATIDSQRTDRWGRTWLSRSWTQPWDGDMLTAELLPLPGGFGVVLTLQSSAMTRSYGGQRLRDYADATLMHWEGDFQQWQDWLTRPDLVPTFLRGIQLDSAKGIPTVRWNTGTFQLGSELSRLPGTPHLVVTPSFLDVAADSITMGIGSVALSPDAEGSSLSMIVRAAPPAADQPRETHQDWRKKVEGKTPYDGKAIDAGKGKLQACRPLPASLKKGQGDPDPSKSSAIWLSVLILDDAPSQSKVNSILSEAFRTTTIPPEQAVAPR